MGSSLSVLASIAILRSSFNDFVPQELRSYIIEFSRRFSSELTIVVKESHEGSTNHLFNALSTYLGSNAFNNPSAPRRMAVGKSESMKVLTYGLDRNSEIIDVFHGVPMKWGYYTDFNSTLHFELRWYELRFHKSYSDMVKNKYLPYILDMAKRIKDQNKVVKFYTTRGGRDGWSSKGIKLDHPMTFETLAMDGELKQQVIEDLDSFIGGKEYYKKIGKIWKRGYLLYGPPGTGKSSLIAAIANYLNFDIYNLNLSAVNSDSSLEYLLLHMSNRSILVVEDIDCSIMLQNRQTQDHQSDSISNNQIPRLPQVTLSGLLNAIDGLLSCCGDERIIIFTTNYKDRIDPALLRAGRMDKHIYLSYCTYSTFKQLAANYLDIWDHDLFSCIERLLKEVQVSPADVAGELMKAKDPKTSLNALIRFLENKKLEAQELEVRSEQSDSFNQKDEQSQKSCKTTDSGDSCFQNENEFKSVTAHSSALKKKEYTVKAEFEHILEAVLLKHGDIAANCSLHSLQCRSSFLDIVCGIIQKLQATETNDLTQFELESMSSSVHDLESVRLEVGWLRQRLEEIIQAVPPKKIKSENVEDTKEMDRKQDDRNEETLTLPKETATTPITNTRLHPLHHKSLVDGLL
ncbi:ATP binding protein, putative [Ricinus communis]|uniref:ATP binding protein, putative n=1 Tax=Ricinus communis TaxID=3988 RepID=B9SXM0_RICCO|nr:ATP binding protein, putative [Ricinus communis]|eukprot:XP_002530739.1 AAA-ATPase At3g50940 [Ricinus communis]